jgi:tellurite resistance protein TerC
MWIGFIAFVCAMLALDLFVLGGNKAHKVSVREAAGWTVTWMTLATTFGVLLWWYLDATAGRDIANRKALEFVTGYLIEQALSVDNMFVFVMIFTYFAVPAELQRRVLLYGVVGAIAMRAIMILGASGWCPSLPGCSICSGCCWLSPGARCCSCTGNSPTWNRTPCCAGCAATCGWLRAFTARRSLCTSTGCAMQHPCSWCC